MGDSLADSAVSSERGGFGGRRRGIDLNILGKGGGEAGGGWRKWRQGFPLFFSLYPRQSDRRHPFSFPTVECLFAAAAVQKWEFGRVKELRAFGTMQVYSVLKAT